MSMPASRSSSLRVLRSNSSQSSFSSDTEPEDIQYASSSAVTTPEDDEQVFRLGKVLSEILSDKRAPATPSQRQKLAVETRPRNLSFARRVKRIALALSTFKKKRPDDISPILIATPLRERFGKSIAIRTHPDDSFYSIPNRQLDVQDLDALDTPCTGGRRFGTISGTSSVSLLTSAFKRERGSGFRLADFSEVPTGVILSSKPPTPAVEREVVLESQKCSTTLYDLLPFLLRALLFLPWCAVVGGALLLFPDHLELVAFRPGYLSSLTGLRRFAHWANFAPQHVTIFLGCVLMAVWYDKTAGLSLTGALLSRFVYVWGSFNLDKNIPLGEDDRQSLYLLAMDAAFAEDTVVTRNESGEISVVKMYTEGQS